MRRPMKQISVTMPDGIHDATALLVRGFASALAEKLRRSEIKYGYGAGWLHDDWEAECKRQLAEHLAKGDPLDVAAYLAFMWRRGWSTTDATNARLAKAAPIMFEALASVWAELADTSDPGLRKIADDARAAIGMAQGS